MEELFIGAARAAVLLIEAAAVLIVTFGSLEALFKLVLVMARPSASHGMRKAIWRRFGVWCSSVSNSPWRPTSSRV